MYNEDVAVPTLSAVSSSTGHAGGGSLVELTGTNFRLPPEPPPGPTTGGTPETLRVTVGGVLATRVAVLSATRAFAVTAAAVTSAIIATPVDVVVQNIDDDGDPIAGETVTLAGGFTFHRPALDGTKRTVIGRVAAALESSFKLQVLANTTVAPVHPDYDRVSVLNTGDLPALTLLGPRLFSHNALRENAFQEADLGAGTEFRLDKPPDFVDAVFDIEGAAAHTEQLLNLLYAVRQHFIRNPELVVQPDPGDAETLRLPLRWDRDPSVVRVTGSNVVKLFRGTLRVIGLEIGGFWEFSNDLSADAEIATAVDTIEVDAGSLAGLLIESYEA